MKKNIIILLFIIAAVAGGFYYYSQSLDNSSSTSEPVSTLPRSVEDLVKQSAGELGEQEASTNSETGSNSSGGDVPVSSGGTVDSACVDSQASNFGCYEDYYRSLTNTKGVSIAFDDLKQRYAQNGYIQSQCHPITHIIGNTAAAMYSDVGIAYIHGDTFCWSGYYHGVMEGVIAIIPRETLPSKLDGFCQTIPGKESYSFDYYNCVHGLGHGVMAITQNELFDSLKLCDNLVGGWEQSSCHGGVFMENVIIDNKNHFTKYLKPEEPLYPCTAVDDKYKSTCYLMQTSYMLKVTSGDFAKVFDLCSQVGNFAATCYQSLGRDASGRSVSNAESTKATCYLGKDFDQKSNCIIGAVKDFVSYFHSDVQAKDFCGKLEDSLQSICLSTTESYYVNFRSS